MLFSESFLDPGRRGEAGEEVVFANWSLGGIALMVSSFSVDCFLLELSACIMVIPLSKSSSQFSSSKRSKKNRIHLLPSHSEPFCPLPLLQVKKLLPASSAHFDSPG